MTTSPSAQNACPSDKILTPANIVTMVRICLVPVFVVALISPWPSWVGYHELDAWKPWIAAVIFIVISCTDWLDGYLARSRNEVTDFGKFMDPLADKILVIAALLVLVELGSLPSWPVIIIVAREFIVSGARMVAASKGQVIAASWYGKFKTVFTMIAIVLFVVKEGTGANAALSNDVNLALYVLSWLVMVIALALTIVSMVDYLYKARFLLGFGGSGAGVSAKAENPGENKGSCANVSDEEGFALAEKVVKAALARGITVGTAESCTGGMVAAALTDVPGSSAAVRGGIVSYVNDVKMQRLGVGSDVLQQEGAVCETVACQMAAGAREALGCDIACSLTGIAGPGGAEPGKPVGTVWIGVANSEGASARVFHFEGSRNDVRQAATNQALCMVCELL